MKNLVLLLSMIVLIAPLARAATFTYGWEDGGTMWTSSPTGGIVATNVNSPVHGGTHAVELADTQTSPSYAYIVWIRGLQAGDQITGSFWRYDVTQNCPTPPCTSHTAPSARIWAHWNDNPNNYNVNDGSASGSSDYGPGTGWDQAQYTWTNNGTTIHTGLMIECRVYSGQGDIVYIDDATVTVPDRVGVTVDFPPAQPTSADATTWGGIKALFH